MLIDRLDKDIDKEEERKTLKRALILRSYLYKIEKAEMSHGKACETTALELGISRSSVINYYSALER